MKKLLTVMLLLTGGYSISHAQTDPLTTMGLRATVGAAPGYVEDRACGFCHVEQYRSYQEVAMAKSFYPPSADKVIEQFSGQPYFHQPSQRYYHMQLRDDAYIFRRYQLDIDDKPINVFEQRVGWILGSGNHARTYLYQTGLGELYQLPLAWYSQSQQWAMAPGFDQADHRGVIRQVKRKCMFCHNAYPEAPEGSDVHHAAQLFPEQLPHGTGCQRCHGPGAKHVRTVLSGETDQEKIRSAIVNPKRLAFQEQEDVCLQCHLQSSVAISSIRQLGRADYSFRPGQSLGDYMVQVDVKEAGKTYQERFEINHHPYRLWQSQCYQKSRGELNCLSCHDPHRKIKPAQHTEHYRAVCLNCHQEKAQDHGPQQAATHAEFAITDNNDCTACHMPERRPQDVVHVTMTDHFIQRDPGPASERLKPLPETTPIIEDIAFLEPWRAPTDDKLTQVYRAMAVLRPGGAAAADAVTHLENKLPHILVTEPTAYLDLAQGLLKQHRYVAAERTIVEIITRMPKHELAREWLALARMGQEDYQVALKLFQELVVEKSQRPEVYFNLALLLIRLDQFEEAAGNLQQVLRLRPNQISAWYYLGAVLERLENNEKAELSYRRALELDPGHDRAYLALGKLLLRQDDREEAERYWRHGVKVARNTQVIRQALAEHFADNN